MITKIKCIIGRNMKKLRFIISCYLTISGFSYAQNEHTINFQILSQKTDFYVSEPVFIEFKFKNQPDSVIFLPTLAYSMRLSLVDLKGKTYKKYSSAEPSFLTQQIPIIPNDSIVGIVDIITLFNQYYLQNNQQFCGLKEGGYEIFFDFKEGDFYFTSNKLSFEIHNPRNQQQIEMLKDYNYVYKRYTTKHNSAEMVATLNAFIEKYPKSIYTPRAIKFLAHKMADNEGYLAYQKKILEEFPDTYSAYNALQMYTLTAFKADKNKAGAENFLMDLLNANKNTLLGRFAKTELTKISALTVEEWLSPELENRRKLVNYQNSKVNNN